jgi:hypothetical protein
LAVSKYNAHQIVAGYLSLDDTTVSLDYKEIIRYLNSNATGSIERVSTGIFIIDDETFGYFYLGSGPTNTYFNTVRFDGTSFDIGDYVLFKNSEGYTANAWALNYQGKYGLIYNPDPGHDVYVYTLAFESTYSEDWNEVFTLPDSSTGGASILLDLTDTPESYDAGKYLVSTASGTEWGDVSDITLLELTDTPSEYDSGKYLFSNISGTEWVTISGITSFAELTDTPSGYENGKYLVSTTSGIEWANISLVDLSDTPSEYNDGKYLRSTESGTEWVTISGISNFVELEDTPSAYDDGKYLRSTASGTEWVTVSGISNFIELEDTPSVYSDGQYLRSTASGIEWATVSGGSSGGATTFWN